MSAAVRWGQMKISLRDSKLWLVHRPFFLSSHLLPSYRQCKINLKIQLNGKVWINSYLWFCDWFCSLYLCYKPRVSWQILDGLAKLWLTWLCWYFWSDINGTNLIVFCSICNVISFIFVDTYFLKCLFRLTAFETWSLLNVQYIYIYIYIYYFFYFFLKKLILLFSKDALNWSKVTVKS